jgi:hypothetical protein
MDPLGYEGGTKGTVAAHASVFVGQCHSSMRNQRAIVCGNNKIDYIITFTLSAGFHKLL